LLLAVVSYYTQEHSTLSNYLPSWLTTGDNLWPALLFLLFFLLKNLIAYYVYTIQAHFAYGVASRISRNQLLHYLNSEYTEYVTRAGAKQNHQINHQPIEFGHYVLSGIQQIITETVLIMLAVTAIFAFNAKLFLVLLVFMLPAVFLAAWFMRKKLRSARANVTSDAGMAIQYLQESLQGYIESQVYGRKQFFTDRYYKYQRRLNDHLARVQIAQWMPGRFVEVFAVAGLFLLILINRHYGTLIDAISIGAFVAAAYKIIPGIGRIATLSSQVRTYSYTVDNLSKEDHTGGIDSSTGMPEINSVAFHKVSFSYGDHSILNHFSFQATKGDLICLSARSGRGKTTLLNLLLGFLTPVEGSILINDNSTESTDRKQWQKRIAYVKQQNFLIHDSIRANITLSEDAADEPRLQRAISTAGLKPFIESFAEGLNKVITDSGKNISGGQRQRIALARALYKDANLIILDEPFNELDEKGQAELLSHLADLSLGGKIIIMVSHNSNAFDWCNKKVEIDA
jgi:ABC-type bacteriocin/lantibiotic exporter with double-glycine peptidase domain